MTFRRCFAVAIVSFFPLAGTAAPAGFDTAVQDLARQWLDDNDGVGLSIGVYDNGQKSFFNAGATRLDGNEVPTADTVYEIGGIAKTFSGQLLARAVVEGRVSLDDTVDKYLGEPYPNLTNGGTPVQLLHLANMTSQLLDNIPDVSQLRALEGTPLAIARMNVHEKYTRKELQWQLHRVAPRAEPGKMLGPSNAAAMVLMVVLEKAYGESFDKLLAREIEKPLRLASGTAPPAKLLARGYTRAGEPLPAYGAELDWGVDSLRYSAKDLLEYAAWQTAERDASVKLAHKGTWSTPDSQQSVGLFWIVTQSAQGRRVYYSGGTHGFAGVCELYPESKLAVVLLANKNAERAQETLRALSAKIVALARPAN